ncbi:hypothetical protein ACO2Q3_14330 [Caulobacter sp. KR2-114]|uniref:hypothetical protein n=1 Tax=Caulobacter sp. KR2-114 TaxID=3400912 RepID=UPI003C005B47
MTADPWWIAMVTIERLNRDQEILPDWALGACGWVAALAPDEDAARKRIEADMSAVGLRLMDVEDLQPVVDADEVSGVDEHLAANMRTLKAGRRTAWGELFCYAAEGEA